MTAAPPDRRLPNRRPANRRPDDASIRPVRVYGKDTGAGGIVYCANRISTPRTPIPRIPITPQQELE